MLEANLDARVVTVVNRASVEEVRAMSEPVVLGQHVLALLARNGMPGYQHTSPTAPLCPSGGAAAAPARGILPNPGLGGRTN